MCIAFWFTFALYVKNLCLEFLKYVRFVFFINIGVYISTGKACVPTPTEDWRSHINITKVSSILTWPSGAVALLHVRYYNFELNYMAIWKYFYWWVRRSLNAKPFLIVYCTMFYHKFPTFSRSILTHTRPK